MRLNYIANALSVSMRYTGIVLLVPVAVALFYQDFNSVLPFLVASFVAVTIGFALRNLVPNTKSLANLNDIKKDEGLFIVAVSTPPKPKCKFKNLISLISFIFSLESIFIFNNSKVSKVARNIEKLV